MGRSMPSTMLSIITDSSVQSCSSCSTGVRGDQSILRVA